MAITYCNTTTDLTNVYYDIERYKGYFEIDSSRWALHSGSIYKLVQSGYVEALYEDGSAMSGVSTLGALTSAGQWYYDQSADILYFWASDSASPATHTIEKGVTWSTYKETCRNDAQEIIEGFLNKIFVTPFRPIISPKESYNSRMYDYWIIRATAVITCHLIIKRLNPKDPIATELWKIVWNPDPVDGEHKGIIQMILDHDVELKIQRSTREPGSYNVYDNPDNTGYFDVSGTYTGSEYQIWRVEIDTAGGPGVATYKFSDDGGTTYSRTLQPTYAEDNRRVHIGSGIYIRFVGTFQSGDYVDIELFPITDQASRTRISYVEVDR